LLSRGFVIIDQLLGTDDAELVVVACEQGYRVESLFSPEIYDVPEVPGYEYIETMHDSDRHVPSIFRFARRHSPFTNERI